VTQLGLVPYTEGIELQERLRDRRQADEVPDTLLLLEHHPVYTKGRRTERADLPMGEEWYLAQGIEVHASDRGGRVTYHGPGQLVGYPVMKVRSVRDYVCALERAVVAALGALGVKADCRDGLTGVWAGEAKIGSIGVHVSRGVTTHGFAVNVDNDLQPFDYVVPCGIENVRMTSVYKETGATGRMPAFREAVANALAEAFALERVDAVAAVSA